MRSLNAYSKPPELESIHPSPNSTEKDSSLTNGESVQAAKVASEYESHVIGKGAKRDGRHTRVPYFWRVLMVLAAALYLIPEAIFNAELVNVAGQGVISEGSLRSIELFGRMISGIGVSLLVCDVIGNRFAKSAGSAFGVAALVFLFCWPTVFFGQKLLVDKYIIDSSSPEERQHAYLSQLVRGALANNTIQIEGIEYDPNHQFNPQEMTFMALFGGMVYADDRLADVFESKGAGVIESMVKKDAYGNFDHHWANYAKLYDTLKVRYTEYAKASKEYNAALADIPERQAHYWSDVDDQVGKGWIEYRKAIDVHNRKARNNAETYGPKIFEYFERRNKCRSNGCISRLDKRYYQEIGKLGLGKIDPEYWHKVVPVSVTENVAGTIGNAIGTLGLSLIAQGADLATGGDGGFKKTKRVYTNDIDHYENKIKALPPFQQKFVDRTGYPSTISSFVAFKRHQLTAEKVRKLLSKKGLSLPNSWRLTDKATFERKVRQKVTAFAKAEWKSKAEQRGIDIAPNIPWKKFQALPVVQKRIKADMGAYYVSPIYVDWNKKTFKQRVMDPAVKRKTQEILERLKSRQESYADGQSNEAVGKQMLRAIVIPPISMGLSLLLVILTILKLPRKIVGLFREPKSTKNLLSLKLAVGAVRFVLVLAIPLFFWSPTYTEDGSTVHYFLSKTAESGGEATKHFLSWVLHAQPIMHPVGETFESATGLYEGSQNIIDALHQIDKRVIGGA